MSNKKTPKIRFEGFTDNWEQCELGEVFDERSDRSAEGELISVTINSGIKKFAELNRHDNSSDDKSKYKVVCKDDIAYNSMRMWQGASGYSPYNGILSPAYTVLIPKVNINSLFFSYMFKKSGMIQTFQLRSQGITSDTWNLKYPAFSRIKTQYPKESEQIKIGEYFKNLDNLIICHQQKHDQLQVVKKSMLGKMFPQNGAKVPEIRFDGFTDDWEEHKLNYYLTTSTKKNLDGMFNKSDVLSVSGEVGVVNQIKHKGRSFAGISVLNYGIVEIGDIVYTKSPLSTSPYGIIKANKGEMGIVSTLYAIYNPNDITCSNFVQVYFEQNARVNNYLKPLVNKGAKNDMKVTDDNALKGKVIFPKLNEQKVIAQYFEKLDNLITSHQKELSKLQNIKKSMLEKMFV